MKLCKDCKHLLGFYCQRLRGEPSRVDGSRVQHRNDAEGERAGGKVIAWLTQSCGRDARFFEAKS